MRKKTARTPDTKGPRHLKHRGLIAKADIPCEPSAVTECALDNLSHRTTLGLTCATRTLTAHARPPARSRQVQTRVMPHTTSLTLLIPSPVSGQGRPIKKHKRSRPGRPKGAN